MLRKLLLLLFLIGLALCPFYLFAQNDDGFKIARVQYRGGGDWYNVPSSLTNLIQYTKEQVPINISPEYDDVQLGSRDIFDYPFLFMTGHGNIAVNNAEMENLREYLENGGFLYVDDDYGMDQYVREILQNIFPDERFFELPADHPIYSNVFNFPDGRPPKVHEHDGKTPQAFAVYRNGRMVLLYTYESNLSDGWESPEVHNTPPEKREQALQMGTNILTYALMNGL